jgi:hypothetical protein
MRARISWGGGAVARLAAGSLALLAALLCLGSAALAQLPEETVGSIAGTDMTRDEFRGRALAQLATIALNAVTYYKLHGEYPKEFYRLRGSESWNLDVENMFTPRPVQAIIFDPAGADYTTDPAIGLPGFEMPSAPTSIGSLPPPGSGTSDPNWVEINPGGVLSSRVNPRKVQNIVGGDIFYYTSDSLLQIVLYAPDGSYYEWVDEVPNHNYLEHLQLRGSDPTGQLLASAEVLYYMQYVLPRYYNLVQFMSGLPTETPQALERAGASRRLEMARSIGVTVRNPFSKQPLALATGSGAAEAGSLAWDEPTIGILLSDGSPATLADLAFAPGEVPPPQVKGNKGGKGGRQPGSGGRQPGGRQPK